MNLGFKYRLYPTKEQEARLRQFCGSTRWLWNYMLDLNQKTYSETKKFAFVYDMANLLPELKKEHAWLKETPSQALQQRCMDLDKALKLVWKSKFGFPKFKSRNRCQDSFRIPQQKANGKDYHIKTSASHLTIPKIGEIKWKYHRELTGKLKSVTISRDNRHWYVSVLCEISDVESKLIDREKTIGIDLGITDFAVLSDGTKIKSPKFLKAKLRHLRKANRQLAKKQKGSNNHRKQSDRIARIHQIIRFQRNDWLHKLSHRLVQKHDLICLEDLKTKSLVKDKKQKPMNRSIADQGWYMFTEMLAYKAKLMGKHVTKIDQYAPSTKTCSNCGHVMPKIALDIREWHCPSCNSEHDRDINAALNIKFWGILSTKHDLFESQDTGGTPEINACGDTSTTDDQTMDWHQLVSLKQEAAIALASQ